MNIRFSTKNFIEGALPLCPQFLFCLDAKKESKKVKALFSSLEKLALVG